MASWFAWQANCGPATIGAVPNFGTVAAGVPFFFAKARELTTSGASQTDARVLKNKFKLRIAELVLHTVTLLEF
jgi:hypothetical protein